MARGIHHCIDLFKELAMFGKVTEKQTATWYKQALRSSNFSTEEKMA